MKDALGHGSDAGNAAAAATLAQDHSKTTQVDMHPAMRGSYAQGGLSAPATRGLGIQSLAVFTARGNKGQNPRAWATAGQREVTDMRQKLFGRRS